MIAIHNQKILVDSLTSKDSLTKALEALKCSEPRRLKAASAKNYLEAITPSIENILKRADQLYSLSQGAINQFLHPASASASPAVKNTLKELKAIVVGSPTYCQAIFDNARIAKDTSAQALEALNALEAGTEIQST